MIHSSAKDLLAALAGIVEVMDSRVVVLDEGKLRERAHELAYNSVFAEGETQAVARWLLWELGQALGIRPASIHDLYMARGRGETGAHWTVPAMNLRGMAADCACAVFRAARARNVWAMIFEIARSEIGYTDQRPAEYTSVVLAAAIKEGYRGPLFLQGDHFQVSARRYASTPEAEVGAVKDLIREGIVGGFYNIDIDTSTLVDLGQPTVTEQQRVNFELCAEMTELIRELEPEGVTISVGGEIGEVGGKNSTEEELRAFMNGYKGSLSEGRAGLSKISIQTGTAHGGVVLPDGTLAQVKIDFDTLERLSAVARTEYGMGGAVQHGASTLPPEAFHRFAQADACEVHLATGFQNIIYEHERLPDELRQQVYAHIKETYVGEWKGGWTEDQFIYKLRKKGFGPFKRQFWDLPEAVRDAVGKVLEQQFAFLFEQLNVVDTVALVQEHVTPPEIHKTPADFGVAGVLEVAADLAD